MKATARSLLLGTILVSTMGMSACSDETEEPAGVGGDTGVGGKATGGAKATGGKAAGGANVGGKAAGGAGVGGAGVGGSVGGAVGTGGKATGGAPGAGAGGVATGGVAPVAGNAGKGGGVAGGPSTGGAPIAGGAGVPGTGGAPIAGGAGAPGTGGAPVAGAGGASAGAPGTAGAAGSTVLPYVINYDFEADAQGWTASNADTTIASSTEQFVTGASSLKVTMPALDSDTTTTTIDADRTISVSGTGVMYPGSVVTFHVYSPAGSGDGVYFQAFSQSNAYAKWDTGAPTAVTRGAWTTWTYTIPDTMPGGIQKLGVQIGVGTGGALAAGGVFYIDAVTSTGGAATCADPASAAAAARYGFEEATTTWKLDGTATDTVLSTSTDQFSGGAQSLKVAMTAVGATGATAAVTRNVYADKITYCGKAVTAKVHLSAEASTAAATVKGFSQHSGWSWAGGTDATLTSATWGDLSYTLPTTVNALGVQRVGLQISIPAAAQPFTGNIYIDDVSW